MTNEVRTELTGWFMKASESFAAIASILARNQAEASAEDAPQEKMYTYEQARAILAEKSRSNHREEVKAILASHGVKQLSDVKDPKLLAAIVAEAEVIGVA